MCGVWRYVEVCAVEEDGCGGVCRVEEGEVWRCVEGGVWRVECGVWRCGKYRKNGEKGVLHVCVHELGGEG